MTRIEHLKLPLKTSPIELGCVCWQELSVGPSIGLFDLRGAEVEIEIEVEKEEEGTTTTEWDWYKGTVVGHEARWNPSQSTKLILIPAEVTPEDYAGPWHLVRFSKE